MPKVTFLLPVHNGDEFIGETIRSILIQDYSDFGVLIINDGSTDRTEEIIESINDTRIRYEYTCASGLVASLNTGLELIDSEYVARIDADDLCFPFRLSAQLEFIEFTRSDAISSRVINMDEASRPWGLSPDSTEFFKSNPNSIPAREPYLPHPFLMARLKAVNEVGGYRPAHLAEDSDLCWRMSERFRIALQESVMGMYRIHTQSVSSRGLSAARVQAFYSQLAALNAVRRRSRRDEVHYSLSLQQSLDMAESISDLLGAYSSQISEQEGKHLAFAASMKLIDISSFRAINLLQEDFEFARTCASECPNLAINNSKIGEMLDLANRSLSKLSKPRDGPRVSSLLGVFGGKRKQTGDRRWLR